MLKFERRVEKKIPFSLRQRLLRSGNLKREIRTSLRKSSKIPETISLWVRLNMEEMRNNLTKRNIKGLFKRTGVPQFLSLRVLHAEIQIILHGLVPRIIPREHETEMKILVVIWSLQMKL